MYLSTCLFLLVLAGQCVADEDDIVGGSISCFVSQEATSGRRAVIRGIGYVPHNHSQQVGKIAFAPSAHRSQSHLFFFCQAFYRRASEWPTNGAKCAPFTA